MATTTTVVTELLWTQIQFASLWKFLPPAQEKIVQRFNVMPGCSTARCRYNSKEDLWEIDCDADAANACLRAICKVVRDFVLTADGNDNLNSLVPLLPDEFLRNANVYDDSLSSQSETSEQRGAELESDADEIDKIQAPGGQLVEAGKHPWNGEASVMHVFETSNKLDFTHFACVLPLGTTNDGTLGRMLVHPKWWPQDLISGGHAARQLKSACLLFGQNFGLAENDWVPSQRSRRPAMVASAHKSGVAPDIFSTLRLRSFESNTGQYLEDAQTRARTMTDAGIVEEFSVASLDHHSSTDELDISRWIMTVPSGNLSVAGGLTQTSYAGQPLVQELSSGTSVPIRNNNVAKKPRPFSSTDRAQGPPQKNPEYALPVQRVADAHESSSGARKQQYRTPKTTSKTLPLSLRGYGAQTTYRGKLPNNTRNHNPYDLLSVMDDSRSASDTGSLDSVSPNCPPQPEEPQELLGTELPERRMFMPSSRHRKSQGSNHQAAYRSRQFQPQNVAQRDDVVNHRNAELVADVDNAAQELAEICQSRSGTKSCTWSGRLYRQVTDVISSEHTSDDLHRRLEIGQVLIKGADISPNATLDCSSIHDQLVATKGFRSDVGAWTPCCTSDRADITYILATLGIANLPDKLIANWELTCTNTAQEEYTVIVDACAENEAYVVAQQDDFAFAYVHFLDNVFDARHRITDVKRELATHQAEVLALVQSLHLDARSLEVASGMPALVGKHNGAISVVAIQLRATARYRVPGTGCFLEVIRVYEAREIARPEARLVGEPGYFKVVPATESELIEQQALWYEINIGNAVESKSPYETPASVVDSDVLDDMCRLAQKLVPAMDHVGIQNKGSGTTIEQRRAAQRRAAQQEPTEEALGPPGW